jgi:molybdopterin/thiamine biosynthesis adenylyltransferase
MSCGAIWQVIHGTSTLDMRKVDSARARILDINPHIHVEVSTVLSTKRYLTAALLYSTQTNCLKLCTG